jgi:toxin ParE1/3/4
MAQIVWTEPALDQLDDIAGYIALDNPSAAAELVKAVFVTVDRLAVFPASGRIPPELPNSVYRELICKPCRIFYRQDGETVFIIYVMREERQLRRYLFEF